jgi:predicted nucleic acid-binding protein
VTLVDSNVLIDIWTDDPQWYDWSLTRLNEAARSGPLLINDVIYAESSVGFLNSEDFDVALVKAKVTVAPMPLLALFQAGKASTEYRRRGGIRTGVLPDFFYRRSRVSGTSTGADPGRAPFSPIFSVGRINCAERLNKRWPCLPKKERGPSLRWSPSTVRALPGMCPNRSCGRGPLRSRPGRTLTCCRRVRCAR